MTTTTTATTTTTTTRKLLKEWSAQEGGWVGRPSTETQHGGKHKEEKEDQNPWVATPATNLVKLEISSVINLVS